MRGVKWQNAIFAAALFIVIPQIKAAVSQDGVSCRLLALLPFSDVSTHDDVNGSLATTWGDDNDPLLSTWTDDFTARFGYSCLAAASLAIDHFNARDPIVVPELAELQNCPVQLTRLSVADTEFDKVSTARAIMDAMYGRERECVVASNSNETTMTSTSADWDFPCGIVGPIRRSNVGQASTILNANRIPLMHFVISHSTAYWESSTVGVNIRMDRVSGALLDYLRDRKYLFIIHGSRPRERSLADSVALAGANHNMTVLKAHERFDAIHSLRLSGIRTVYLILDQFSSLVQMAEQLDAEGLLTPDYVYILKSEAVPSDRLPALLLNAPPSITKLLHGALAVDILDGFRWKAEDRFLQAWRSQNADLVARINEIVPAAPPGKGPKFTAPDDYFQKEEPLNFASFMYDAVMLLGLGGCKEVEARKQAQQQSPNADGLRPPRNGGNNTSGGGGQEAGENSGGGQRGDSGGGQRGDSGGGQRGDSSGGQRDLQRRPGGGGGGDGWGGPGGGGPRKKHPIPHMQGILETSFDGASGKVSFAPNDKVNRATDGMAVGLYNIRANQQEEEDESSPTTSNSTVLLPFEHVLVSVWHEATGWEDLEGQSVIHSDGSTSLPLITRVLIEENHLHTWVRGLGLSLVGLAWAFAIMNMLAIWYLRSDAIVQRAQPFFIILLCAGSFIMSTAVFTLSWDEGAGWSDKQLDIACMMTPWFFFVGHIMVFSALFTKLWRVDTVLQFRRQAVRIKHVISPLLVLLFLTLAGLTLWTILDPWTWRRNEVRQIPAETYGECTNERFWAFFGPLLGLLVLAESITAYFAWKTADLPEDFRDSNVVFLTLCMHIQSWATGLPILAVLGDSSADATYIGRVFLIFIFSVSSVACVACPKIAQAMALRRNPSMRRSRSRVSVSGIARSGFFFLKGGTQRSSLRTEGGQRNPRSSLRTEGGPQRDDPSSTLRTEGGQRNPRSSLRTEGGPLRDDPSSTLRTECGPQQDPLSPIRTEEGGH